MALLFADEDFPYSAVEHLRGLGHDVVTVSDVGLARMGTDVDVILSTAVNLGRTVMTMNRRHFTALHNLDPDHCGIVTCSHDSDGVALAGRIHRALQSRPDMRGELVRVNLIES